MENFLTEIEKLGYKTRMVPIECADDLKYEIETLKKDGLIEDSFLKRYLCNFKYDYSDILANAKSIIIIAIPQPITILNLSWKGKAHKLVLPPVYIHSDTDKQVTETADSFHIKTGFSFAAASLPLKLLGVRSGLCKYGRNNISYIEGIGSFYRLTALISDIPCDDKKWHKTDIMKNCKNCSLCINNCPTGCIDNSRFLIHAQNCLTNLNENSGSFPDWLDINSHNALVGCMRCQMICPENKSHIYFNEIENFLSENEISLILDGKSVDELPEKTVSLLDKYGLMDYYPENILSRNLNILLSKESI